MLREMLLPTISSQTTNVWTISAAEDIKITIDKVSMNVASALIESPRQKSWEDVMNAVLRDRSQTWEELANL